MVYKVIGLMSGSSLDGLDIVYTSLEESRGVWKFDIHEAACIAYEEEWTEVLRHANTLSVPEFLKLHTKYGHYLGQKVNEFIEQHSLQHQVHFIATHGHTAFHEPQHQTTFQLGDGASLAAATGVPVISDLRSLDVALGGQGAPIVPIGDKLLFGDFDYWLNIGGIVNITAKKEDNLIAFDVCPGNQILNALAEREGKLMDEEGLMAQQGVVLGNVIEQLNRQEYYNRQPPKSLSNEAARDLIFPIMLESAHTTNDLLRTTVQHIAQQVTNAVKQFPTTNADAKMLVTGGGAFNNFMIEQMKEALQPTGVSVVVPYEQVVKYKEALVMALIGALRWREETNVLSSATGASRDSISGTIWMGHSYGNG